MFVNLVIIHLEKNRHWKPPETTATATTTTSEEEEEDDDGDADDDGDDGDMETYGTKSELIGHKCVHVSHKRCKMICLEKGLPQTRQQTRKCQD